ncbi:RQC domain-containing protein [Hungatella effluvii]|uniref:RQC domain-containing protein n=1 Tax=Hungatella effluvii TaxID=1096246 RepID=A0A2V3Y6S8_9FIRM|nr:RQC-minor-1 family DNA-binding protein [Hungatella effluvii]PXX53695.1 RQC domain-containing protein [Hungatella effluvii]
MARRQRIRYELNTGEITKLQPEEIRVILRAADEMIATAGRSMLVKVLKGSKDKKVLEYKLDECPSYGYYHDLTMEEIGKRVDYMIVKRYLRIEYSGRLPMLVFTDKGWEMECETYTSEWVCRFKEVVESKVLRLDMFEELKIVNRQVVFAMLDKIKEIGDKRYIPVLKTWQKGEVRKVRQKLEGVITVLENREE